MPVQCYIIFFARLGEAYTAKHLLHKHKDQSLTQNSHKLLSVVAQVCNPRNGEVEAGKPLGLTGQPV